MHCQVNEILFKFYMLSKCIIKLPFCFNNSLNSSRRAFFEFADKLFHKTLPLTFNEFIPYFRIVASGIKSEYGIFIPFLSEYGIFTSAYVFHIKLGLSLFLDLNVLKTKNYKCL